jgi:hypothetical protein
MKYRIEELEVYRQTYEVEAESEEEALRLYNLGDMEERNKYFEGLLSDYAESKPIAYEVE